MCMCVRAPVCVCVCVCVSVCVDMRVSFVHISHLYIEYSCVMLSS